MKMKKFLAVCLSALTVTGMLAGCGGAKGGDTSSAGAEKEGSSAEGSVYYLNFKPEIADQWEEIAAKYTEETGVPVKVKTAASNQYEQTLKSEMAKSDAPTLFQINGPVGYQSWKEYCADLKDTEFYNMLVDKDLAITEGDGVYGIPFAEEGYGIIYNKEIMDKYFALPGAKATSMDDIKNFDTLKAVVEDMTARLAKNQEEAEEIMEQGNIPVIVDPKAECIQWFQPDVIVDAILAKRNLGTKITDAPFVIGVGPGFTAGEDCNCVVETKRGHTLGNVIWDGSAIPNTGVPGNVGGYSIERLIKASADGVIEPKAVIGDLVRKGQIVAITGGEPVYALMDGIVRGMLQPGVQVTKGLKIGDIDARAKQEHCRTISDKARAIGGGVLDAVCSYEKSRGKYALILLAAGQSVRFGSDKLKAVVEGEAMYESAISRFEAFQGFKSYVVTGKEEITLSAESAGCTVVCNKEPEKGISLSVKLGLTKAIEDADENGTPLRGVLFSVCDQPRLKKSTIQRIINTAFHNPGKIVCAGEGTRNGNPVLWDKRFFDKLLELDGDIGGKKILKENLDSLKIVPVQAGELQDIDRKEDLGTA